MSMTLDEARKIAMDKPNGFHSNVAFDLAAHILREAGERPLGQLAETKANVQRVKRACENKDIRTALSFLDNMPGNNPEEF